MITQKIMPKANPFAKGLSIIVMSQLVSSMFALLQSEYLHLAMLHVQVVPLLVKYGVYYGYTFLIPCLAVIVPSHNGKRKCCFL